MTKHVIMNAFAAGLLFCGVASASQAAVVIADATGADNQETTDFWGITFDSGTGFIQSVSFDVTASPNAFFDFDAGSNFGNASGPVVGALSGLLPGDISFTTSLPVGANSDHPAVLTFNFAAGTFGVGDAMRFSADTDLCGGDPARGDLMAACGVVFSVMLEGGDTGSASFVTTTAANQSVAAVTVGNGGTGGDVPEPATLALLGAGLFGLGYARRRRST